MNIQEIKIMLSTNLRTLNSPGTNLGTAEIIFSRTEIEKENEGEVVRAIVEKFKDVEAFYAHTGIGFKLMDRTFTMSCAMSPNFFVFAQVQFSSEMTSAEKDAFMDKVKQMLG